MTKYIFVIIGFIILYSLFVGLVEITIQGYSEIIVASVFSFTFFSGFFIARQNDRYSEMLKVISASDGLFSHLYRISSLMPRVQDKVREIIRQHYEKIAKSNNWAYHTLNPSTTITMLTRAFGKISEEEFSPVVSTTYTEIWTDLSELQKLRKKTIILYHQKLLPLQWTLIYILGGLLIFSFDLIQASSIIIQVSKVIFGIAVFLAIILLKQLDELAIFGKDFSKKTAYDIFRILEEKDIEEIEKI